MRPVWIALALVGCADKTDDDYRAEITAAMHDTVDTELVELAAAARELQAAAPAHGWTADGVAPMRAAWRRARVAYEHVEGALAPIFPDIDFAIDARYDDYLAQLPAGDSDPFDGVGVTGMHAIERILFADQIRDEVVAFESTLPGYQPAAMPATDADAIAFRTGLAQRLVDDIDALRAQWQPANIDIGAAYIGMVGLMNEQKEKVDRAATGEEESRYANVTLFDLRNNREGTSRVYGVFRAWIASKGGDASDAAIRDRLDALGALYGDESDALPPVPPTWSSDMPSVADRATPFGMLWTSVHEAVDPHGEGSIVFEMNQVAELLGFPEFVAR